MRPLRVLVVDDEYWVCENLKSLLQAYGRGLMVLDPAHDGEAALARIATDLPDLVITDIDMPFMGGNQLIKEVRRRYPLVQTVVLSGYSEFSYAREALLDGALDYLLKPVDPPALEKILDRVREVAEGRWAEDQSAASQLEDGALTVLLQEPESAPLSLGDFPPLHLAFPVFTLLLVRVGDLPRTAWNLQGDPKVFAFRVKSLVAREASGAGAHAVFQNQLCRNEFLLLSDREDSLARALAHRVSENLGRLLGTSVEVAISLPFYTQAKVRDAYREAKSALFAQSAGSPSSVVSYSDVKGRPPQGRISPEQEKRLALAVSAEDLSLVREILFEEIGLKRAQEWLLTEVQHTAVFLAGFLARRTLIPATRLGLLQEAFHSHLSRAVQARNLVEVCALLDGWIDEVLGEGLGQKTASVSMRQTVRRVKERIEDHYFDDLSLASLAETFRVESSYLSKAFKQVTGTNLMAAIARRRIEKAKEYIRDRPLSLVEVASLVGYEEYAYFNRVFHKMEGVSPSEYKTRVGR